KSSSHTTIAQKYFKDDVDNEEYERQYERDVQRFYPEKKTSDLTLREFGKQESKSPSGCELIAGLGTGEVQKPGPKWRYKSTRPW
ncbi:MAG: hypothetical protein EZS28_032690, partial [Streblomastix strix]